MKTNGICTGYINSNSQRQLQKTKRNPENILKWFNGIDFNLDIIIVSVDIKRRNKVIAQFNRLTISHCISVRPFISGY